MNDTLQRRLIGLAVLLSAAFLLSLLLPAFDGGDDAPPSVTVALGSEPVTEADAVPPPDALPPDAALDVDTGSELPVASPSSSASPSDAEPGADSGADSGADLGADSESDSAGIDARPPPSPSARDGAAGTSLRLAPEVTPAASPPAASAPASARKPTPVPSASPRSAPVHPKPKLSESVATPPPADAVAGWYVQVGSYSRPGSAQTIVALLDRIGVTTRVTRISGQNGQPLDRVRAGPFDSEARARQVQAKIAKGGYPQSRVVREPSR